MLAQNLFICISWIFYANIMCENLKILSVKLSPMENDREIEC